MLISLPAEEDDLQFNNALREERLHYNSKQSNIRDRYSFKSLQFTITFKFAWGARKYICSSIEKKKKSDEDTSDCGTFIALYTALSI